MFQLFKDDDYWIYQAKFDNPVTINVFEQVITLDGTCIIGLQPNLIVLYSNVTKIKCKNQTKINFSYKNKYQLYKLDWYENKYVLVRDFIKRVNNGIIKTYEPGGHMYKKSQAIIESSSIETR